MGELAANFEKQTGNESEVDVRIKREFFSRRTKRAPFDLFFSADVEYAKKLEAGGQAEPGTLLRICGGPNRNLVSGGFESGGCERGLECPARRECTEDCDRQPGTCAVWKGGGGGAEEGRDLREGGTKLVFGENISQAAQFVQSGNAQAGIIALSLAISPPMRDGKSCRCRRRCIRPSSKRPSVLKSAKDKDAARAFLEFVKSKEGRATLEKFGFVIPEPDQGSLRTIAMDALLLSFSWLHVSPRS